MTEALDSTARPGAAEHSRRTPGTPCWVSLLVRDLEAAEEFYGTLFGWEFRPQPSTGLLGCAVLALLDGREIAGIGRLTGRELPASWTVYLASDDVDTTAEQVRHRGGTVGLGPLDVPTAGRLAVACDPSGALFGILDAPATGFPRGGTEQGAPVWIELTTYDTRRAATFYQSVFKHVPQSEPAAGPDRLTLHLADGPVASVRGMSGALPHEHGASWTTYFETPDVDASAARATELGGTVLKPPRDGVHGRVATVADPEGAEFTLVHTPL